MYYIIILHNVSIIDVYTSIYIHVLIKKDLLWKNGSMGCVPSPKQWKQTWMEQELIFNITRDRGIN